MKKGLCIVGAGGFGREVAEAFRQCVSAGTEHDCSVLFAEEKSDHRARTLHGVDVVALEDVPRSDYRFFIAIANIAARRRIAETLAGVDFATIVHPSAVLGTSVRLGEGSIVAAGCILTCDIQLGHHTHLNLSTTVGHDAVCGDFLTTAPGARISGACRLGSGVFMGSNAVLREKVYVADDAQIGAGAVVLQDIDEAGLWAGVPARKLR